MRQFLTDIGKGMLIYLGFLTIDFFVAMLSVSHSGTMETALGIRIETVMDAHSMSNMVTGTWTLLLSFVAFLVCWQIYCYYKRARQHK
ncbi:hypothetical protein [Fructobacillus ficulneus]|uniref:Uncharacterized protein n=1 Tax=Fructobacillus ficulneus TaxID=157463 RepID=A0A0K8MG56_9LACO|nr:hypothetical protein [Fructobacillus ficulneus]GAO99521.1 hypothetical protein FFIC_230050 [Fructobacillus ficulneus]